MSTPISISCANVNNGAGGKKIAIAFARGRGGGAKMFRELDNFAVQNARDEG